MEDHCAAKLAVSPVSLLILHIPLKYFLLSRVSHKTISHGK